MQPAPQYRNYPQPTNRSPHATQPRRGPGPMVAPQGHPPAAMTPHQLQAHQQVQQQQREAAKRQAKKPTDKNMPEGVEGLVIGDGVQNYRKLREVERKLDAAMMRKRLDISESITRNMTKYQTMRMWISNTAENQPWQMTSLEPDAFDFNTDSQATYRVKIEGRLLDDEDDAGPADDADEGHDQQGSRDGGDAMDQDGGDAAKKPQLPPKPQRRKLAHFFKSIIIDFDRSSSLQPDGFTSIEWKKPTAQNDVPNSSDAANFDCLEFERKGDENINITVKLIRDENPERYKLKPALAALLDTDEDDRAGVIMGIWGYVQAMGLQTDEDTKMIQCDAKLKAVFGQDTLLFPQLPTAIQAHLLPLPPIELNYTIRVDKNYIAPAPASGTAPSAATIYDVRVPLEDPLRMQMVAIHASPAFTQALAQITHLDDQIALAVQAVAQSKAKHAFFTAMSKDPVNFIKRWIGSQRRDLEVILGEATRGGGEEGQGEEWRRGGKEGVWGSEAARESVALWLARSKAIH